MLRCAATDDVDLVLPTQHFTIRADGLDRRSYFHNTLRKKLALSSARTGSTPVEVARPPYAPHPPKSEAHRYGTMNGLIRCTDLRFRKIDVNVPQPRLALGKTRGSPDGRYEPRIVPTPKKYLNMLGNILWRFIKKIRRFPPPPRQSATPL
jgi:hypothetical protein